MDNFKKQHLLIADDLEWVKIKRLATEQGMSTSAYVVLCALADEQDKPDAANDIAPNNIANNDTEQNYAMDLRNKIALNAGQQKHLYDLVKGIANTQYNLLKTNNPNEPNHGEMLRYIYQTHKQVFEFICKSRKQGDRT